MQIIIDIPEKRYKDIQRIASVQLYMRSDTVEQIIAKGTLLKDCEQWKQLKETITEIRDNNKYKGNGVTDICRFLINYMGVLEDADSN